MNATNTPVNFTDILKDSVVKNFTADIAISKILLTFFITYVIALFIYFLYKRTFSGVLYSRSFNVSLIGTAMVTSLVILAIGSNLILSLGMVGALSIVRFRTPIKDPTDLIFLFWSISVGIVSGAGFYALAAIGSILVGLVLFLTIKKSSFEEPYLLVVNCDGDQSEKEIHAVVQKAAKRFNIRTKTVTAGNVEVTLELRLRNSETDFVNSINRLPGIKSAVLVSYNGDYVS